MKLRQLPMGWQIAQAGGCRPRRDHYGITRREALRNRTFNVTQRSLEARRVAMSLMLQHGLSDWTFAFNGSKRSCGYCWYPTSVRPGRIELSVHFAELNSPEEIRDCILHEIAHALVGPEHGHDRTWKRKCIEIGARPNRCNRMADMPKGKWKATCPGCQRNYHRHRKPKTPTGYFCKTCGPVRGQIVWKGE